MKPMSIMFGLLLAMPSAGGCAQKTAARAPESSSRYPRKGSELRFPEERDWLGEAGLTDAKRYAALARPNIGVSEAKLGMSHLDFRNKIERAVYEAVLSESPKIHLDRIKREKFGVIATEHGAPAEPVLTDRSLSLTQRWKRFTTEHPESLKMARAELGRVEKLGAKLNPVIADEILGVARQVVATRGDARNTLQVAKAFVAGSYYFVGDAMEYEWLERSCGPMKPDIRWGRVLAYEGTLGLDRPRGVCHDFSATLYGVLKHKAKALGFTPFIYAVKTRETNTARFMYGCDHDLIGVRYADGSCEYYDPTQKRTLTSPDTDALVKFIVLRNGYRLKDGIPGTWVSNGTSYVLKEGDPISTLSRADFEALPNSFCDRVDRAIP